MERLDHPDWLLREYDYSAGMSPAQMAEKYSVTHQQVSAWKTKRGWTQATTVTELLKLKIKRILFAAETELVRGDLDDCTKRLKAINLYLKTYQDIDALGGFKQTGKAMNDKHPKSENPDQSVDEIRFELQKRLEDIVGPEETKSAFGRCGVPYQGRDDNADTST